MRALQFGELFQHWIVESVVQSCAWSPSQRVQIQVLLVHTIFAPPRINIDGFIIPPPPPQRIFSLFESDRRGKGVDATLKVDHMNTSQQIDPAARDLANNIIGRLHPLDETIANARGFRALLQDLHARELSTVQEPHVTAIHVVRAGILRAAIGTIMAAVDKRGDDRASIGQIIHMLEVLDLSIFADRWQDPTFGARTLRQATDDWQALLQSDDFKDCRSLRDNAIAHTLTLATPTVQNDTYFRLHDAAEELTLKFFRICGYGTPLFLEQQTRLTSTAKVFWDTYRAGLGNLHRAISGVSA